MEEEICWIYFL